ncbi:T9SS type A sorting domain-containing protein [Tunicatimonas pelagia]|uniref:T9SS type A sorting domain-containing protein n=1 Tax=Tunicatimonas pelagia TaxID=931531 RepID=UPI002665A6B1|nr:T9SS type A sorting domain-containing protein [Tunicatimonas pelagia]WKN45287.1 T9SS type A sorting domain-containing protein [Tunicatimonas pelagia]
MVEDSLLNPEPLAIAAQTSSSTDHTPNGSISLSVTGGIAPYNYEWSNNATTAFISDPAPGDFSITVTDAVGCTSAANFFVDGVTSVQPLEEEKILVYPNPNYGKLYVDLSSKAKKNKVTLYDMMGQKVIERSLQYGQNIIYTKNIKSGNYLLRFNDGRSQRVVIR